MQRRGRRRERARRGLDLLVHRALSKKPAADAPPALPTRGPAPTRRGAAAPRPGCPTRPRASAGRGQRILVAEDNPVNQRVVAAVLQKAGWTHALVENGIQAVEAFAAETFDLVLMDCQMPVHGRLRGDAPDPRRSSAARACRSSP